MNQKKTIIIAVISAVIIFIGIVLWYGMYVPNNKTITNYEECAAAGHPILDSYPEQCRAPGGKTYKHEIPSSDKATPVTISGTTTCLPHKNTDGPHTMECAIGLETENGKYYGIGTDPYDMKLSETSRKVQVTGTLKTNSDSKYNSEGTITVTSYEFLD